MENQIAVLLPIYSKDNPDWFQLAVESVLNQEKCLPIIHIGIDGPIGEILIRVLESYKNNKRIIIHKFSENRGLACVLNDLINFALKDNMKYIARMDADDISLSDRFITQINFLKKHPDIDVVGSYISEIDEKSNSRDKIIIYPREHVECRKHFRYRDPLAHPAVMFRKSYFDKVAGYRPEFRKNQDTMMWFDGFMNGCKFANIDKVLLKFRVTNDFYNRRNGFARAKSMLINRFRINKALNYDITANFFAVLMFLMTISPKCIKKFLYKIRK